jgi:prevent-host-death family protein
MPVVGIREFSRTLSEVIARVEKGETVLLTRHGKPTAAILPIQGDRLEALTLAAAPKFVMEAAESVEELRAGGSSDLDELLAEAEAAERAEGRQPAKAT